MEDNQDGQHAGWSTCPVRRCWGYRARLTWRRGYLGHGGAKEQPCSICEKTKKDRARLVAVVRQQAQAETREVQTHKEKLSHQDTSQAVDQVARRVCSFCPQRFSRSGQVKPRVTGSDLTADPASNRRLDAPRSLPH